MLVLLMLLWQVHTGRRRNIVPIVHIQQIGFLCH